MTVRRLATYGVAYAMFCAAVIFTGCADALLLHPSTGGIELEAGVRRTVPFEDGVLDVVVRRTSDVEPKYFVLAFTGNAGRAELESESVCELFAEKPVEVWALNPPGYGESSGRARLSNLVPSALAVFDELSRRAAGRPVFVYGNSMGGAVALAVAANRECAGLIARNPPPLRSLILREHGWWNLWLIAIPVALSIPSDLQADDNAARAKCRAIFLQANRDEIVPTRFQDEIEAAYAGEKRKVLFQGGHNDPLRGEPLRAARLAIGAWLIEP